MSQSVNLEAWDKEAAVKGADFEKLRQMLLQAKDSQDNVEILWRLAMATVQLSLNLSSDKMALIAKNVEALKYAEKAVKLDGKHFNSNLWLASAALLLVVFDEGQKMKHLVALLASLRKCSEQNSEHPLVLSMEGGLPLLLARFSNEDKSKLQDLPKQDFAGAMQKLEKSIQLDETRIINYWLLSTLLATKMAQVIERGLKQRRYTKYDEDVAKDIQKLKDSLMWLNIVMSG